MLGLTFEKLIVIAVFAAFILGPERLPHYASKLADLVRAVRGFTETAKARAVEQLGPEFEQTDWTKLDPRRFDPRRIVQEALAPDSDAVGGSGSGAENQDTIAPIGASPAVPDSADVEPVEPAQLAFRRSSDGHLIRL